MTLAPPSEAPAGAHPDRAARRGRASGAGLLLALFALVLLGAAVLAAAFVAAGRFAPAAGPSALDGAAWSAGAPGAADEIASLVDQRLGSARQLDRLALAAAWAGVSGAVLAMGVAVFLTFVCPALDGAPPVRARRRVGRLLGLAVVAVVVAELVELVLRAGATLGRSGIGPGVDGLLFTLQGPVGASCLLRIAGVTVVWLALASRFAAMRRPVSVVRGGVALIGALQVSALAVRRLVVVSGVGITLASFAVVGHPQASSPRLALILVHVVHTLAASIWLGGVAMLAVMLHELRLLGRSVARGSGAVEDLVAPRREVALAAGRFSALAGGAVAAVAGAGAVLAASQLPSPSALFTSSYGQTLLVKLVLVGLVVALGGYNHRWLVPRVGRGDDEQAWAQFRLTVTLEAVVIVGGILLASVALAGGGLRGWWS